MSVVYYVCNFHCVVPKFLVGVIAIGNAFMHTVMGLVNSLAAQSPLALPIKQTLNKYYQIVIFQLPNAHCPRPQSLQ